MNPTLDALATRPAIAATLDTDTVRRLTLQCLAVLGTLATVPAPAPVAPVPEGRWVTVPEVSARLGFVESYVYELLPGGRIPGRRIGKY